MILFFRICFIYQINDTWREIKSTVQGRIYIIILWNFHFQVPWLDKGLLGFRDKERTFCHACSIWQYYSTSDRSWHADAGQTISYDECSETPAISLLPIWRRHAHLWPPLEQPLFMLTTASTQNTIRPGNYDFLFLLDLEPRSSLPLFFPLLFDSFSFPSFSAPLLLDFTLITPPESIFPLPFSRAFSRSINFRCLLLYEETKKKCKKKRKRVQVPNIFGWHLTWLYKKKM